MLGPIVQKLAGRKVILASESPRRKEILHHIGFPFEVIPSRFEETLDKSKFTEPWQYAVENARGKAWEVANRIKDDMSWYVVIGADTIVWTLWDLVNCRIGTHLGGGALCVPNREVKDGDIFEKPKTPEKAREMLHRLQGTTHNVYTGMALVFRNAETLSERNFEVCTEVTFAELSEDIIEAYILSREPLDKAGAYGIQGLGGTLIKSIVGDYYNVVGLPLHSLCLELLNILSTQ